MTPEVDETSGADEHGRDSEGSEDGTNLASISEHEKNGGMPEPVKGAMPKLKKTSFLVRILGTCKFIEMLRGAMTREGGAV